MMQDTGKMLVMLGLGIVVVGVLIWLLNDKLSWFGNLPGDIKIEKENFKMYAPIASMIIVSVVLNILWYLFNRFMR